MAAFDSGHYPNDLAEHIHTILTWNHQHPIDIRGAARENIVSEYETTMIGDVAIEKLQMVEDGYIKAIDKHEGDTGNWGDAILSQWDISSDI